MSEDFRIRLNPDLVPHELRDGYDIRLPVVVAFHGLGWCFYSIVGFRPAKHGEFYLTQPDPNDDNLVEGMRSNGPGIVNCWIVRPTFKARCIALRWEVGEPVVTPDTIASPIKDDLPIGGSER